VGGNGRGLSYMPSMFRSSEVRVSRVGRKGRAAGIFQTR
jgi:hypothetical protein